MTFQFTHPGGVRLVLGPAEVGSLTVFQFTHPGGVRHNPIRLEGSRLASFNSRTREGCDWIEEVR